MSRINKKSYLLIFSLFVTWRTIVFVISYLSKNFISTFGNRFPYVDTLKESGLPYWLWSFGNFDGVHYLRIAQDGYAYQYTQVFFPLYPVLIKMVSFITFGNFVVAGLLISNVAFIAGLILFYKLISQNYNRKIAFWSCLFF